MFYNKLTAVLENQKTTETLFLKSIRNVTTGEILAFLNLMYPDKNYCTVYIDPADSLTNEDDFIPNVIFGGSFYTITYENVMNITQVICISSEKFPSEDMMMTHNESLSKFRKINVIRSVEMISFGKVIMEYQKQNWVFPDKWLIPCEQI